MLHGSDRLTRQRILSQCPGTHTAPCEQPLRLCGPFPMCHTCRHRTRRRIPLCQPPPPCPHGHPLRAPAPSCSSHQCQYSHTSQMTPPPTHQSRRCCLPPLNSSIEHPRRTSLSACNCSHETESKPSRPMHCICHCCCKPPPLTLSLLPGPVPPTKRPPHLHRPPARHC